MKSPIFIIFASFYLLFSFQNLNSEANVINKNNVQFIVQRINFEGNKVTKDFILYRELELKKGDTLSFTLLDSLVLKSRENLLNTSLFNFVNTQIDTLSNQSGDYFVGVTFDVIERWYVWPFPIFEFADRNFNAWWKDKDFSKVNYGIFLVWDNFRGRKEKLKLLTRFGYDEKYKLFYEIPYINKKRTIGLGFGIDYAQNHEISYQTLNNKLEFFKAENFYPKKHFKLISMVIFRPDIHNTYIMEIGCNRMKIADTIVKLNPEYLINDETRLNYFSVYFKYKSDFRDFVYYPLNGYYFDVIMNKYGLGLLKEDNLDVFTLQSTFRKYQKISRRWYFASLLTAQFSSHHRIPYYIQSGLGYGRILVRGYELYVVDGQNYGLFRSNVKFAIIPTKVYNINFIKTERFSKIHVALYLNLFFDAAYVTDRYTFENNPLANQFLYGTGIGLDLVSYYDIVFRFELSRNKQNETGVFVHFMAPI